MVVLKDLAKKEVLITGGHRACSGCGFPILIKMVLSQVETPVVVANATGCMEVTTTVYPYTAWKCSYIHSAFANAAATMSGVKTAYRSLKKQGKLDKEITFIAFGGDGGTYDIGLQSLSGAMERGHKMLYICYDNQAYMNTGVQRSGATPRGTNTSTTPAGTKSTGKGHIRKDLTAIMAAHNIPYVAQAAISHWNDLVRKVKRALEVDGPAFLNVYTACRLGWAIPPEASIDVVDGAVQTNFWPLYEVDHGEWRLTFKPKKKVPLADWLKQQGRFKHLFRGDYSDVLEQMQAEVDEAFAQLCKRCGVEP